MKFRYSLPLAYQIQEELYRFDRTVLLRCRVEGQEHPILVKMPEAEFPSMDDVTNYHHEYRVLDKLQGHGAVRVHKLEEYQGRPFLVLEDKGGQSIGSCLEERTFSIDEILKILLQAADALGQLQSRGIIHQQITPWSFLWSSASQRLQLIGFGQSTEIQPDGNSPYRYQRQTSGDLLAYMSPEQASQTNQGVDHRSDFYSLGAVVWHLLIGSPPFSAKDTKALIHARLARRLLPPHQLRGDIPLVLSEIILKLLSWYPDARYQSARGLALDMRRCIEALEKEEAAFFALGQDDQAHVFLRPARLYGREKEQATLHRAFEQARTGTMEFVLINGASGVGKSLLVQSLEESIHQKKGTFAAGRFELLHGENPYLAIQMALRGVLQHILAEKPSGLLYWKTRLQQVLGNNRGVLVHLLPELTHLLGDIPEVIQIRAAEERVRVHMAFSDVIRGLAAPKHPLVLLLDDLQWADRSSLELIEFLASDQSLKGFVLAGAYRDADVADSSDISVFLESIRKRDLAHVRIALGALPFRAINQMLAELCERSLEDVAALAGLLLEKTAGNPFFLRIMLQQIYRAHLLWKDASGWSWSEAKIRALPATDNVVSLLAEGLQKQPKEAQEALQYAACLGHEFLRSSLVGLLDLSAEEVAQLLQPNVDTGLLQQQSMEDDARYCFVHDRVQEAAYALMAEEERVAAHLLLGRYLLLQTPELEESDILYDVVRHLQQGLPHMQHQEERLQAVRLAMAAGQRAQAAGAFESAYLLFVWGLDVLGEPRWSAHYDLTYTLCCAAIETGMACRERKSVSRQIDELLQHGRTLVDQAPAWKAQAIELVNQQQMKPALALINDFRKRAGSPLLSTRPDMSTFLDLFRLLMRMRGRRPDVLLALPKVKDPLLQCILDLEILAVPALFWESPKLAALGFPSSILNTLRYGLTGPNIQPIVGLGILYAGGLGWVDKGLECGDVALQLLEKIQRPDLWPRIALVVHLGLTPWKQSYQTLTQSFQDVATRSLELGDFFSSLHSRVLHSFTAYLAGTPLPLVASYLEQSEQMQTHFFQHHMSQYFSHPLYELIDVLCAEQAPSQHAQGAKEPKGRDESLVGEWGADIIQLQLSLLFGFWREAFGFAMVKRLSLRAPISVMFRGPYWTYALIAIYHGIGEGWVSHRKCRGLIRWGLRQLRGWARHLPPSRQYCLAWVEAATLRCQKKGFLALEQYDLAFEQARDAELNQDAGLIAEQAAALCDELGHTSMARHYRQEASMHYLQWGATAKVNQLKQREAKLLPQRATHQQALESDDAMRAHHSEHEHHPPGLKAVVEAMQVIAKESDLQSFVQRFMRLIVAYTSAERGLLLLHQAGVWLIVAQVKSAEAEAESCHIAVHLDQENAYLSTAMLRYVILTHQAVVLQDASAEGPFLRDPYVLEAAPRSVLCTPMLLRDRLFGMLIVENARIPGVFTEERQELLSLLATQAAMGIQMLPDTRANDPLPSASARSGAALPTSGSKQTLDEPFPQTFFGAKSNGAARATLVGKTIGKWRIIRPMEEGGMSLILKAQHIETNQVAAVKLLLHDRQEEAIRSRRFEHEIQLLQSFEHPHIIKLLDSGVDPVYGLFMALECLEGENLQAILERCAPLPLGWLLVVFEQICNALSLVHQRGILHRDLKPSNIFLSPGKEYPHVHLLDFGIASRFELQADMRLTSTGVIVGTPAYLAPEQIKEAKSLSPATDIYALGVMLFEALTGQHPMGTGSLMEIFVKILQDEPIALGQLRPEFLHSGLESTLAQMLAKNPQHRPNDVLMMWNEFVVESQFLEDPCDLPERYPDIRV